MKVNPVETKGQKTIAFTGRPYPLHKGTIRQGHFPEYHSVESPEPSKNKEFLDSLIAMGHLYRHVLPDGTGILLDILA